jgi:hypothetical protein
LGLNIEEISALLYQVNETTYSSYIFGTSFGFDATALIENTDPFCGYVIKYDGTDLTID